MVRWALSAIVLAGMAAVASLALSSPTPAGRVAVVTVSLTDNGDDDGYADTQETVSLRPVVLNTTGIDLTGVRLRLSTTDGARACLTLPEIDVGTLLAGEERPTAEALVFVVPPGVERQTLDEDLSVVFDVSITSNEIADVAGFQTIRLDLDLDLAGGSGPTSFHEGFEVASGFGAFEPMNLDEGRHSIPGSEDHRCQYADPDQQLVGGPPNGYFFYLLGASEEHADAFWWRIDGPDADDGGRAFEGSRSLHFGVALGGGLGHTTPLQMLEAVRTGSPIHLGWDGLAPELSFKHQVSLMDSRWLTVTPGETVDRAVVMLQLADAAGDPASPWVKLEPSLNGYDQFGTDDYTWGSPTFDPVDDGTTEDDLFEPGHPYPRLGPSSTCFPERVFAWLGDTDDPYDPANVGNGDGPGLQGTSGSGTWVESRFDLSRYRGRSVRLRFLATTISLGGVETWDGLFQFNPDPADDGWWIDDVRVTGALTTPATVTVDDKDNSDLPFGLADMDGDEVPDPCDNCIADPDTTQADADGDLVGDVCDPCPQDADDDADADGSCAPYDNCPALANPGQEDADGDGWGDPCDTCPAYPNPDQDSDGDDDGVSCLVDNCPGDPNPAQQDEDGDGLGDACDGCPGDPLNDPDEDDVCATADSCPVLANPLQGVAIEVADGAGSGFRLSPDESTLVVVGDLVLPGNADNDLFSVPATGGQFVRLYDADSEFQPQYAIGGDGSRVVFRYYSGTSLYSVPIGGGDLTELNTSDPTKLVYDFTVSEDGLRVVYVRDVGAGSLGRVLYSVAVDGGPSTRLSPERPDVEAYDPVISADGTRVLYRADEEIDGVFDLYAVPVLGGTPVKLNGPLAGEPTVQVYRFASGGSRVLYIAQQGAPGAWELYSVPAAGGTATRISGPMVPGGSMLYVPGGGYDRPYRLTPDGTRAVYWADQETDNDFRLYSVAVAGGPVTSLTPPGEDVLEYVLTPDGATVVYSTATGLRAVPVTGGPAVQLDSLVTNWTISNRFRTTPQGRVVYRKNPASAGASRQLLSVPVDGSSAPVQLNEWSDPFGGSLTFDVSADGGRVVYAARHGGEFIDELFGVSVTGGPVVRLSDGVAVDSTNLDYAVSADGAVAWWSPSDTTYASWWAHDDDGDGIHVACDNCARVANASQVDADGDGSGQACDCDDLDGATWPGAPQVCDGANNDCEDPGWPAVPADEADADADGVASCAGDCDDADGATHPGAVESNDGQDNQCPGDAGHGLVDELAPAVRFEDAVTLAWDGQPGATRYEVLRSDAAGFSTGCGCASTPATSWIDAVIPGAGAASYYLVRGAEPFQGSAGAASDGTERTGACLAFACP